MKKMLKVTLGLASLLIFCSWVLQPNNTIKKAEWLLGTWENKTSRGSMFETWTKLTEFEYSGKSYMVQGKDTIVFERVQLLQEKESLFYIPTVTNQNGGLPVRFKVKLVSDSEMVFENPLHDFPQVISYRKINSDSLVAEISGVKNGKERKQSFPMKRNEK